MLHGERHVDQESKPAGKKKQADRQHRGIAFGRIGAWKLRGSRCFARSLRRIGFFVASRLPLLALGHQSSFVRVEHRDFVILLEGLFEVVQILEVFQAIFRGLRHLADLDELENDVAKVGGRLDAPIV